MRTVSRTVPAPAGLRGELVGVPVGSDLVLDLRLESVSEGVLVSGAVQVTLAGECARCLDPLTEDLEVAIQQLFVYPGREVETDADDEIGRLVDDYIDLEPLIRDAVVLALPLAPVCRDDCPGLCPECGVRLADVEPGHGHDQVDLRWAALRTMSTIPNGSTEQQCATEDHRTTEDHRATEQQRTTDEQES